MRLCAISIDLDELPNYFAIHGLVDRDGESSSLVYDRALERAAQFAERFNLPLTLFVIGADLERAENARKLRALAESGHELGNHSLDHLYDLTRRDRFELLRQVRGGIARIVEGTGYEPKGFRAPGYTVTDTLFEVLAECGIRYDSSVFPCPPYYAAKLTAMSGMRLRGRASRSVADSPNVLRAPTVPYRVGRPYWQRGSGVLELPIQVVGRLRVPFIGTALSLIGPAGARYLARLLAGQEFINLELHGIDFLDVHDGLAALAPHQPDVRVPVSRKLTVLREVVDELRQHGYRFVRLDEAAGVFGGRVG